MHLKLFLKEYSILDLVMKTTDICKFLQFTGKEEYSYNDVPALARDNQAQSAIVTGCSAWTIYQVLTCRVELDSF